MRLSKIFEEQQSVKYKVKGTHQYSELFETTAALYWTGIYKLNTLPLSESAYNTSLSSLQQMILETALNLPRNMIPVFSKYIDDSILQEGFWDSVGTAIDKADVVVKQGKEMVGKAVSGAVKGVYKGAALALTAGAGLVSDLTKKVSPELHERFVKFGKAAKDYILAKLQSAYDSIVLNLQKLQVKVATMFSKTCNVQSIADGLDLSISDFHKFLVESAEMSSDPVDVATEILKNNPTLDPVDQIVKASATVWYRTNASLKGDVITKIANHVLSQSTDKKLKVIVNTDALISYIKENDIIKKVQSYNPEELKYNPTESFSPDTLSPRECESMNDPSLIEQLLAKVPEDAFYKKTLEDLGAKSEDITSTFKNAFKAEKRNVILGIISAALSIATGAAPLNFAIAIGGTLVPALIRVLAAYFKSKGMDNAAMVTEKVAKVVSILATAAQILNLANLVKGMITGTDADFISAAGAEQPTPDATQQTAAAVEPTQDDVPADSPDPSVTETFNALQRAGLEVDEALLAEKMANITPEAVEEFKKLAVGDIAASQKTLDFLMTSKEELTTYRISATKILLLGGTTGDPAYSFTAAHFKAMIDNKDNPLNPDEFFNLFKTHESMRNYLNQSQHLVDGITDPTEFFAVFKTLQLNGVDINSKMLIDENNILWQNGDEVGNITELVKPQGMKI